MMDDDKKTVLLPRFADMMSYHTVVMEKPPEMTVGLTPSRPAVPRAPRMQKPQAKPVQVTHLAPAASDEDPLRTRMAKVEVAQVPLPPPPPRAPAPPPPPQKSGTMKTKPARPPQDRKQLVRKIAIFGGAAIVLSVSLLLPLSGGGGDSQAASIPASAVTQEVASTPTESVQETEPAKPLPSLSPPDPSITEERAATLLLQGRQREALTMYQKLANSSKQSPGIEAMARVLSQKVESE